MTRSFVDRFVDAGRRRAFARSFRAWTADCTATGADKGRRPSTNGACHGLDHPRDRRSVPRHGSHQLRVRFALRRAPNAVLPRDDQTCVFSFLARRLAAAFLSGIVDVRCVPWPGTAAVRFRRGRNLVLRSRRTIGIGCSSMPLPIYVSKSSTMQRCIQAARCGSLPLPRFT